MVVDGRMSRFIWLTRSIPEALIGVLPAGIQHGEPGERCEVHRSSSLAWTDRVPQVEAYLKSTGAVTLTRRDLSYCPPTSVRGTIRTGHLARFNTPSATLPRKR